MDANHLLDQPGVNYECSEDQSLEEIVASVIENHIEDEAEEDLVPFEPIT